MRLFKRREKITIEGLLGPSSGETTKSPPTPLPKAILSFSCPEHLASTGMCVCMTCPRRNNCMIELMARSSGHAYNTPCQSFIRYCSIRSTLFSGGRDWADLVLKELESDLRKG